MKNQVSIETQINSIWKYIRGFHIIHFVYTGHELGLFSRILKEGNKGISSQSLAREKSLDISYVDKWCASGIAWGILEDVKKQKVCLSPHMDVILTKPGDPRYLLPYVKSCVDHFGPDMKNHSKYYKDGNTFKFQEHSYEFSDDIGSITEGLQTLVVNKIIPSIAEVDKVLTDGGKLLDYGCGTAKLLTKASLFYTDALFYGIDIDKSGIDIGNRSIKKHKLDNRIKLIYSSNERFLHADSIDVVTMIEVFHEISLGERLNVLKNISSLLKKKGFFIILDETMPEREYLREPSANLAVLTQYNEMTWGNIVPKASEQEELLSKAGFYILERKLIGGLFTLLICKPL